MKIKIAMGATLLAGLSVLSGGEDNLLKNQDFSAKDDKGKIAYWRPSTSGELIAENGILKQNIVTPAARSKDFTGGIIQQVKEWKPGNYEFSGCYRGELNALYVVVKGYTAERKSVNLLAKWFVRKDFRTDGANPGWNKFYYCFAVPAEYVSGSVHIEGWNNQEGNIELMKIELAEADE